MKPLKNLGDSPYSLQSWYQCELVKQLGWKRGYFCNNNDAQHPTTELKFAVNAFETCVNFQFQPPNILLGCQFRFAGRAFEGGR